MTIRIDVSESTKKYNRAAEVRLRALELARLLRQKRDLEGLLRLVERHTKK